MLSSFEVQQLNLILKKFVKQIASGPQLQPLRQGESELETASLLEEKSHPLSRSDGKASSNVFSLEKLISVAENLTKSHFAIVQKHQKKMSSDFSNQAYKASELTFNFVRCLVLDNIVENPLLLSAFLTN